MLESYPYVFKADPYNFTSGQTGLTFVGIFAGGFTSMLCYFIFLRQHQDHCFDADGNITPEERLWPAVPGGLFVPLGLLLYGWTTHLHWIFVVPFYEYFDPGIASSLLAALGLLFVPWPIILLYRGRQLRMRSKNARHDI